ncbi:MAG: DinB family protein [Candidatus Promineifilaceae bacterium]
MSENTLYELGQLTALAERLADEGQMNLNKLVEAAVYSITRRAGRTHRPQISTDMMQDELVTAVRTLRKRDVSPDLIAAMEVGLHALQTDRGGDMMADEAPDVFVCRNCGHATLGLPPDHCPVCGSWPGRFRKFVAFFNRDNIEPLNPTVVLDLLAENGDGLARLVAGLSEEKMNRQLAGDAWSIRDHIAHFYDTQEMLDTRVDLMLNHDNPDLAAMAVYEFATEADRHPTTAQGILETFRRKREACVARLREQPLSNLYRTGYHPEFGELTILRQAAYMAFHEQVHLPEIEALRQEIVNL